MTEGRCAWLRNANFTEATTIMRCANVIVAGLVVFAGIYTLVTVGDILTLRVATIAISAYLICFGCILCMFELRIGFLDRFLRDKFGFMFTYIGRTLFLFFIGSLCFPKEQLVTYIVGGIAMGDACLNLFFMWKHGEVYGDPTGKYATAEETGINYMRENPDLARAAAGHAVDYARSNPEAARAGMSYAQSNSNPFAREQV